MIFKKMFWNLEFVEKGLILSGLVLFLFLPHVLHY